MEDDKQSLRADYENRIIAELDETCAMFDQKIADEIAELKVFVHTFIISPMLPIYGFIFAKMNTANSFKSHKN